MEIFQFRFAAHRQLAASRQQAFHFSVARGIDIHYIPDIQLTLGPALDYSTSSSARNTSKTLIQTHKGIEC